MDMFALVLPLVVWDHGPPHPVMAQRYRLATQETAPVAMPPTPAVDYRSPLWPPKDQQQCGNCYVYAAAAAIESRTFMETGSYPVVSETRVTGCTGQEGCLGGGPSDILQELAEQSYACGCESGDDTLAQCWHAPENQVNDGTHQSDPAYCQLCAGDNTCAPCPVETQDPWYGRQRSCDNVRTDASTTSRTAMSSMAFCGSRSYKGYCYEPTTSCSTCCMNKDNVGTPLLAEYGYTTTAQRATCTNVCTNQIAVHGFRRAFTPNPTPAHPYGVIPHCSAGADCANTISEWLRPPHGSAVVVGIDATSGQYIANGIAVTQKWDSGIRGLQLLPDIQYTGVAMYGNCTNPSTDHAVTVVGENTAEDGTPLLDRTQLMG